MNALPPLTFFWSLAVMAGLGWANTFYAERVRLDVPYAMKVWSAQGLWETLALLLPTLLIGGLIVVVGTLGVLNQARRWQTWWVYSAQVVGAAGGVAFFETLAVGLMMPITKMPLLAERFVLIGGLVLALMVLFTLALRMLPEA